MACAKNASCVAQTMQAWQGGDAGGRGGLDVGAQLEPSMVGRDEVHMPRFVFAHKVDVHGHATAGR